MRFLLCAGDLNAIYVILEYIPRRWSCGTVRTHNKVTPRATARHLNTSEHYDLSTWRPLNEI